MPADGAEGTVPLDRCITQEEREKWVLRRGSGFFERKGDSDAGAVSVSTNQQS